MDFGASGWLLVGVCTEAWSFLEAAFLLDGSAGVLADEDLRELDGSAGRKGGNVVDAWVEAVVASNLGKFVVPNAVGYRGFLRPSIQGGQLAGFSIERVAGSPSVQGSLLLGGVIEGAKLFPAVIACELLGSGVKGWRRRLGDPAVVTGELLDFIVEGERCGFRWCWDPTVLPGELLNFVGEGWGARLGNPTIVAGELLDVVRESGWGWGWNWSPTMVAYDLSKFVVERNLGENRDERWLRGWESGGCVLGLIRRGDSGSIGTAFGGVLERRGWSVGHGRSRWLGLGCASCENGCLRKL